MTHSTTSSVERYRWALRATREQLAEITSHADRPPHHRVEHILSTDAPRMTTFKPGDEIGFPMLHINFGAWDATAAEYRALPISNAAYEWLVAQSVGQVAFLEYELWDATYELVLLEGNLAGLVLVEYIGTHAFDQMRLPPCLAETPKLAISEHDDTFAPEALGTLSFSDARALVSRIHLALGAIDYLTDPLTDPLTNSLIPAPTEVHPHGH